MSDLVLSKRDVVVLRAMLRGDSDQMIATEIGLSLNTAKNYFKELRDRIGMDTKLEVALWFLHHHPELCADIGVCEVCRDHARPYEPGGIVFGPEEDRRWPR